MQSWPDQEIKKEQELSSQHVCRRKSGNVSTFPFPGPQAVRMAERWNRRTVCVPPFLFLFSFFVGPMPRKRRTNPLVHTKKKKKEKSRNCWTATAIRRHYVIKFLELRANTVPCPLFSLTFCFLAQDWCGAKGTVGPDKKKRKVDSCHHCGPTRVSVHIAQ